MAGPTFLHDDTVPVAATGLGSRRLTALALQRAQLHDGSVVVIDEVEHGLEPHRLLHLLAKLREALTPPATPAGSGPPGYGQVLMSTPSPVTVTELRAEDLHVVRADAGNVTITRVPDVLRAAAHSDAQGTVWAAPAALLARRVIVGEGPAAGDDADDDDDRLRPVPYRFVVGPDTVLDCDPREVVQTLLANPPPRFGQRLRNGERQGKDRSCRTRAPRHPGCGHRGI